MNRFTLCAIRASFPVLLLLLSCSPAVAGGMAVSNLDEPWTQYDAHSVNYSQWFAGGFITGDDATVLESATIWIQSSISYGHFALSIYDNAGYLPGNKLTGGDLVGTSSPGPGQHTYAGNVPLEANTWYWLVASIDGAYADTYAWRYTRSIGETSSMGWTIYDRPAYINSSGNWTLSYSPQFFSISVVPEPMTLGLLGLGGLALLRRRSR